MEWISVKDRLPPVADYYNCKRYIIFDDIVLFACFFNNKWIDDPDGLYQILDPTHWMPLPAPPKR